MQNLNEFGREMVWGMFNEKTQRVWVRLCYVQEYPLRTKEEMNHCLGRCFDDRDMSGAINELRKENERLKSAIRQALEILNLCSDVKGEGDE